LIYNKATIGN